MRLMHLGKAPPNPSLRPQKPFLLQPRCGSGTKEKNVHISSLSSFLSLSGLGLSGAALLSHLSLAATASEFHSSPQQSVGVGFSHILAPPPQRRPQGPETQFSLRLLLSRCSFTTQDKPPHHACLSGGFDGYSSAVFWTLPKMAYKDLTLPWLPGHRGGSSASIWRELRQE